MVSLQFLITSLIVVLIPGTGVIYTVSTGLTQGKKASLYVALGCTLGIVPHLLATILGLAALMQHQCGGISTTQMGRGRVLVLRGLGHLARQIGVSTG